jgi:hypothetical protein
MNSEQEWSVEVVRVRPRDLPDEEIPYMAEMGEAALEELGDYAPAFSYGDDRYSIRVAIDFDWPVPAMSEAIERVMKISGSVGLPDWPIAHVEATDWDEFERGLSEATYPDLIGVTELAGILNVSKQRASELARQSTFPAPIAQLASGPVWLEPTVRRFVAEWVRRPGRPRSREEGAVIDEIRAGVREQDDYPG